MNIAIYLICHNGIPFETAYDARLIQKVSVEGEVPITYFFSGIELESLVKNREMMTRAAGRDIIEGIQKRFINPRVGDADKHKPELGVAPFHHIPLVQPWFQDMWGGYLELLVKEDFRRSIQFVEKHFHKTPVTCHPPDGVYAPAAAHALRELGFDTIAISTDFLEHRQDALLWTSELRHLQRTCYISPAGNPDHHNLMKIIRWCEDNGYEQVIFGCDSNEFNGTSGGISLEQGIAYLLRVGEAVYQSQTLHLINCNGAAHSYSRNQELSDIWPWNNVHGMIRAGGKLNWIDTERNGIVGENIRQLLRRHTEGWNINVAREHLLTGSDIALRNEDFCYADFLTKLFYDSQHEVERLLQ